MTAKMRFISKKDPTITITIQYIAPRYGISASIKLNMKELQASIETIWNTV